MVAAFTHPPWLIDDDDGIAENVESRISECLEQGRPAHQEHDQDNGRLEAINEEMFQFSGCLLSRNFPDDCITQGCQECTNHLLGVSPVTTRFRRRCGPHVFPSFGTHMNGNTYFHGLISCQNSRCSKHNKENQLDTHNLRFTTCSN